MTEFIDNTPWTVFVLIAMSFALLVMLLALGIAAWSDTKDERDEA